MQISNEVMQVLERAAFDGPRLRITEQLDRKLYTDVNKALEAAGGKWNRGAKAHVFDGDAAELMEEILQTGEYARVKQDMGQFDTPPAIVALMLASAGKLQGKVVLEPSAGIGNIVMMAMADGAEVWAYELDPKRYAVLTKRAGSFANVYEQDFLQLSADDEVPGPGFDVVLMNPPFAKQADIQHVLHASRFLKPGGKLVAIMSASVTFRQNRRTAAFRDWVAENHGTITMLPDGAFAESGTMVRACMVTAQN